MHGMSEILLTGPATHDREIGKVWSLRVHEVMAPLYHDYLNISRFGMLPANSDTERYQDAITIVVGYLTHF